MSGFKLIAIIPLAGCSTDYRKNLDIGKPYQFYKNYEIVLDKEHTKVESVTKLTEHNVPDNLYKLDNGISLNFSAVVGKNGTGKSAIFELLYYFVYLLCTEEVKNLSNETNDLLKKFQNTEKDLYLLKEHIKENVLNPITFEISYKIYKDYSLDLSRWKDVKSTESFIENVKNELSSYYSGLKVRSQKENTKPKFAISIVYESHGTIKQISYYGDKFSHFGFADNGQPLFNRIKSFNLKDLFYSISLNYSHHAVNSLSLGNWINKLFHKNDAYITPVVINPFREEGNFDINHELKLSKERLMANLLFDIVYNKKFRILGKYSVLKFRFTRKDSLLVYEKKMDLKDGKKLFRHYYDRDNISESKAYKILKAKIPSLNEKRVKMLIKDTGSYWNLAFAYLERKIKRISENYSTVIYDTEANDGDKLLEFINNDKTHITKKIGQTLHYLTITYFDETMLFFFKDNRPEKNGFTAELDTNKMLEWLEKCNPKYKELSASELLEMGLPGFFNIDFVFYNQEKEDKDGIEFGKLSSGEQQMILNTNTLLYHLYNLNSVHGDAGNQRIKYDNINIILDEIELYYHPEMQRKLVNELCKNFERVRGIGEKGIKAINVCILTHSPFILSDIPKQNVLVLKAEGDADEDIQSFGANINEMLLSKFYMDATIGEHVKNLINEFLVFYRKVLITNENGALEDIKKEYDIRKFEFVVNNIGDQMIQSILRNHLDFIEEKFKNVK